MTLLLAGSATRCRFALRERRWARVREEEAKHWAESVAEKQAGDDNSGRRRCAFLTAQAQVRQDSAPDLAVLLGSRLSTSQGGAGSGRLPLLQLLQRRAPLVRMIHTDGVPLRSLAQSSDAGIGWRRVLTTGRCAFGMSATLGTLARAHGNDVGLAFSSDGKRLFSAGKTSWFGRGTPNPRTRLGRRSGAAFGSWHGGAFAFCESRWSLFGVGSDDGMIPFQDQKPVSELSVRRLREIIEAGARRWSTAPDSRH
ncbi:MAG: hypothetical protein U0787_08745 [Polyangia bacterium]